MPHDPDEKPPAREAPAGFDFNKLPRWRSKLFPAPDEPPAEPAPRKPVPAPARETTPEVATPEPEGAAVLDLDKLPRVRPVFMLTPDDSPGKPAPQKPATAASNETSFERDPENVPRVRPKFGVRTDKLGGRRTLQKPAPTPAPRKTTGEDWRAGALAERANEAPVQAEEPARESEAALRAFLDAPEAEAQSETPLAEDEQDPAG